MPPPAKYVVLQSMAINFLEHPQSGKMFPFSATQSVADLRVGIFTIREKWHRLLHIKGWIPEEEKQLPAWVIPTLENVDRLWKNEIEPIDHQLIYPWDLIFLNDRAIRADIAILQASNTEFVLPDTNQYIAPEQIFIEPGARLQHCVLNASNGPIYIAKSAELMEGCLLRGPVAIGEGAVLKMGTKVYGATTIGKFCVAGGEIKNSILMAYSNKAHDGYLGDSAVGAWCNFGAGTSNSNVKNTAGNVKMWSEYDQQYISVGTKCGLVMGDYSRAAINTSFNTGTVVGVCCNIFQAGFPPKFIPSFTWGTERYLLNKAIEDIANWKRFKGELVTTEEIAQLEKIFEQ
jgi:UDP-N-acetylglucosamine diphosphorylase / glucose-1-phosphate thymidylyltransferase / UDP-N-acetylgalactosamine diphosphorylase / glucosamine-1-phosphate N-acetyltransferase / galactosamine-1-phosphate N-acetyltransferase